MNWNSIYIFQITLPEGIGVLIILMMLDYNKFSCLIFSRNESPSRPESNRLQKYDATFSPRTNTFSSQSKLKVHCISHPNQFSFLHVLLSIRQAEKPVIIDISVRILKQQWHIT